MDRIDRFIVRKRYRRRASFLKAVSLLSLESYREAALYLDTLDPRHGPDAATKSFLQACAAAGQALDATAIAHLTSCFAIDPTYRAEAETVPALASLLPYFDVADGGSVA